MYRARPGTRHRGTLADRETALAGGDGPIGVGLQPHYIVVAIAVGRDGDRARAAAHIQHPDIGGHEGSQDTADFEGMIELTIISQRVERLRRQAKRVIIRSLGENIALATKIHTRHAPRFTPLPALRSPNHIA